jgi:hypothetical protein
LFRQNASRDWSAVIARIRDALAAKLERELKAPTST